MPYRRPLPTDRRSQIADGSPSGHTYIPCRFCRASLPPSGSLPFGEGRRRSGKNPAKRFNTFPWNAERKVPAPSHMCEEKKKTGRWGRRACRGTKQGQAISAKTRRYYVQCRPFYAYIDTIVAFFSYVFLTKIGLLVVRVRGHHLRRDQTAGKPQKKCGGN